MKKKGVIISVEAMLAALLLFGSFLIAASLATASDEQPSGLPLLRLYTLDVSRLGADSGAWGTVLSDSLADDSKISALASHLPPSVCLQLEIYHNTTRSSDLAYSYVNSSCNRTVDTPQYQWWRALVRRGNSSSNEFYWVKTMTYPAGS